MFVFTLSLSVRSQDDLVHQGDVIDVDVIGSFEFDWRGRLSSDGSLDGFNSYGAPIFGQCRSETSISADIAKALSKFLRDPKVVVKIIDRAGRPVVILDGAVKTPYRFQLHRTVRLRELIVLSGGIRDDASGDIQIFRPPSLNCSDSKNASDIGSSNGSPVINITIKELISGDPNADPIIRSGDIITVRIADVIYLIGGVADPKQISSRETTTLSRAIASAGGLSKQADSGRISIYRRENGVTSVIETDLKKIQSGETADPQLKGFDIVEVAVKGAEKRKVPPMIADRKNSRESSPLRIVD